MKGKKVLEFLILKPAFTSRNISSLGLVALFFLVYWLAGGKVSVPNVKQGSNFGSVTRQEKSNQTTPLQTTAPYPFPKSDTASPAMPGEHMGQEEKTKQLEEKLKKLNELEERLKSLKRAKSGGD